MSQHRPGHGGLTVDITLEYHKPALSTAEVMSNEWPQREGRGDCCMQTGTCSPSHARCPAAGTATDCLTESGGEQSHWLVVAVESLSGDSGVI